MTAANYLVRKGKMMCGLAPEQTGPVIDELVAADVAGAIDIVGGRFGPAGTSAGPVWDRQPDQPDSAWDGRRS